MLKEGVGLIGSTWCHLSDTRNDINLTDGARGNGFIGAVIAGDIRDGEGNFIVPEVERIDIDEGCRGTVRIREHTYNVTGCIF